MVELREQPDEAQATDISENGTGFDSSQGSVHQAAINVRESPNERNPTAPPAPAAPTGRRIFGDREPRPRHNAPTLNPSADHMFSVFRRAQQRRRGTTEPIPASVRRMAEIVAENVLDRRTREQTNPRPSNREMNDEIMSWYVWESSRYEQLLTEEQRIAYFDPIIFDEVEELMATRAASNELREALQVARPNSENQANRTGLAEPIEERQADTLSADQDASEPPNSGDVINRGPTPQLD